MKTFKDQELKSAESFIRDELKTKIDEYINDNNLAELKKILLYEHAFNIKPMDWLDQIISDTCYYEKKEIFDYLILVQESNNLDLSSSIILSVDLGLFSFVKVLLNHSSFKNAFTDTSVGFLHEISPARVLSRAFFHKDKKMQDLLLTKDLFINVKNIALNYTFIDLAGDYEDKTDQMSELLNYEIDINFDNSEAIYCAVISNNIKHIQFLINHNINLNKDNLILGASVLPEYKAIEVLNLLYKNGADIHCNNDEALRATVSEYGSKKINIQVVKWLLDHSLDPKIKDSDGNDSFDIVKEPKILELLEEYK